MFELFTVKKLNKDLCLCCELNHTEFGIIVTNKAFYSNSFSRNKKGNGLSSPITKLCYFEKKKILMQNLFASTQLSLERNNILLKKR